MKIRECENPNERMTDGNRETRTARENIQNKKRERGRKRDGTLPGRLTGSDLPPPTLTPTALPTPTSVRFGTYDTPERRKEAEGLCQLLPDCAHAVDAMVLRLAHLLPVERSTSKSKQTM